jgi:hypothetical protein
MNFVHMNNICIPNISREERQKRLKGGVVTLLISMVVLVTLVVTGVNYWWRLALFPLFAAAASGFFQWRDKT